MKNFAVFIDRDGTINEEVGYLDHIDKLRILPGVPDAIRKLNQAEIPAFVITNQSGIGRGYFTMDFLNTVHERMIHHLLQQGCRIDGLYLCPHHPNVVCACRKPRPGMLLKAAKENEICLHRSYVIGDKIIDIELAHHVGARGILVLTGYGAEELRGINRLNVKPAHVSSNLSTAVDWILAQEGANPNTMPPTPYGNRILIIKPSSLGDIIHSLPVLWSLRKSYPKAHIGWVVKEAWKDILTGNPLLDDVIVLGEGVSGFLSVIQTIRRGEYDIVIDLQGLFRSGFLSFFSGARNRIGFSNAREGAPLFYNHKIIVPDHPIHAVDRYLLITEVIASEAKQSDTRNQSEQSIKSNFRIASGTMSPRNDIKLRPHFPVYIEIEDDAWSRDFLKNNGLNIVEPVIAINPSARWMKKRWPASFFAALINQLIQKLKAGIIILGSKGDIAVAEEISSLLFGPHVAAAGTTTLKTLTALLARVDILVTNDSGPMHLAAAVGTPVVALFGPTDPVLTGPYGDGHRVLRSDLDCSPCFRKGCIHGRPLCMESITPDEVMEAVKKTLEVRTGGIHGNK